MPRKNRPHPHAWVAEPLQDDVSYMEKKMFGCLACYFRGRMVLVLADQPKRPWRGVLLPTSREFQPSLIKDFPVLKPHPVLGKWLYLPDDLEEFEETASELVEAIQRGDERLGIEPKERKKTKPKKKAKAAPRRF